MFGFSLVLVFLSFMLLMHYKSMREKMCIKSGIRVFFLAIFLLVAECIVFGSLLFINDSGTASESAQSFVTFSVPGIILVTAVTGIFYPLCAWFAQRTQNKQMAFTVFIVILTAFILAYLIWDYRFLNVLLFQG